MKIKKDAKFFILLLVAILVLLLINLYKVNLQNSFYDKGHELTDKDTSTVQNIQKGDEICQTFVAKKNHLSSLILQLDPLKSQANINGTVLLSLQDADGNSLYEEEIPYLYIKGNGKHQIHFKKQENSAEKAYTISLKFSEIDEGQSFYSVKYIPLSDTDKENGETSFSINGEKQKGRLLYQDLYQNTKKIALCVAFALVTIGIVVAVSIRMYYAKNLTVEKAFLYTIPAIAILFLVAMPFGKNHDELTHWFRAYEVSEGALLAGENGTEAPEAVYLDINGMDWEKINYQQLVEKSKILIQKDQTGIINSTAAAFYSSVQYIPQVIGIWLGKLLSHHILTVAYAARICNMIVALCLTFLAIRITPFGKKIFLALLYIPILMEGFTSMSPDALTISIAYLFVAYVLHLKFDPKIQKIQGKHRAILLLLAIILAFCKIVYIPLVGLLLLLPKEKFKNVPNKYIHIAVIAGIAVILNLLWLKISMHYLSGYTGSASKVQLMHILKSPIQYLQMVLYSLDHYGNHYLLPLFGSELGWGEKVQLDSLIPYVLAFGFGLVALLDSTIKQKFSTWDKVIMTLIVLAITGLIFTSLYMQWTAIDSTIIEGVQGRYFLPFMPLLAILAGSIVKVKSEYSNETLTKVIAITGLVVQVGVIMTIVAVHL